MTNKFLKLTAVLCTVFATSLSFSQGALRWHFGDNALIDFSSGTPVGSCTSSIDLNQEGTAGVTNNLGTDLFYTDGVTIYDVNGDAFPGANGSLLGGSSSATSAMIVPDVTNSNIYVVFTVDAIGATDVEGNGNNGINYTLVDMTLAGNGTVGAPLGDVVTGQVNQPLVTGSQSERFTAVPKADGSGYYVLVLDVTGGATSGVLRTFDVTGSTVNTTSISNLNWPHWVTNQGFMKSNHRGDQIAVSSNERIYLIDFNNATGATSNWRQFKHISGAQTWGIEYSPNDDVLYSSCLTPVSLRSWDLSSGNDATALATEQTFTYPGAQGGAVQMGPDGRIYVAHNQAWTNTLGVFTDPDNFANPGWNQTGYTHPCNGIFIGLPAFVPALVVTINCTNPGTITLNASVNDFCEGGSSVLTATEIPTHMFYWVNETTGDTIQRGQNLNQITVTETGDYHVYVADPVDLSDAGCASTSNSVEINEHNNPTLGGDIVGEDTVCEGTSSEQYEYTGDLNLGSYSSVNWITGLANLNGAIYSNTNNPSVVNFSGVTNFSQVVTLSLYATEAHGVATCVSDTVTYDVVVQETPSLDVSPLTFDIACNSTGNEITINNYNSTSNYLITESVASIVASQTGGTITFSVGDEDGEITIQEVTSAGCSSPVVDVEIDVNGCGIEADFDVSLTELCADSTIRLTSTAVAGEDATITGYNWVFNPSAGVTVTNFDNGSPDSSWVEITVSNGTSTPATLEIIHTVTNNWGLSDDTVAVDVITINPNPEDIDVTHNGVLCDGDTSVFDVVTYDANSSYTWTSTISQLVQGEDSAAYINTGSNYTVSVQEENQYGCFGDTATYEVNVEQNPNLVLDPANQTVNCLSTGNTVSILSYDVNSTYFVSTSIGTITTSGPDASGIITFDVGTDAGTIFVTQETANGCISNEGSSTVGVVGCGLEADFIVDAAGCSGDTVTFTSTSDPGAGASIVTYNWTFPSGLTPIGVTDAAVVQAILSNGTLLNDSLTVSLEIVTDAALTADTTKTNILVIYPLPGGVTINSSGLICSSESLTFNVTPYNATSTYDWSTTNSNGIASSGADSAVVLNGTTDYVVYVQETSVSSCVGPLDSIEVTVEEDPILDLVDELNVACESTGNIYTIPNFDASSTYTLLDTTGGIVVTITGDEITFDVLDQNGSFTIQQETSNGCTSNIESVNVNVLGCGISAIFDVSGGSCSGDTVVFDGTASFAGAGDNIIDYNWTFPSGVTPVAYNSDSSIVTALVSNVSSQADTLAVTLDVVSQLGLADDTTQVEAWIVNPLPLDPAIAMSGGTCPGDTMTFTVSPFNDDLTVTWGPSSINTLIYQADADSIVLINPDSDYNVTAHLTNSVTGCENLVDASEDVVMTQLPTIVSIEEPNGLVCPFTAANSNYDLNATVQNATSVQWTSINGDAIFFPSNSESTSVSFNASNDTVWVVLEALNSACASSDLDTVAIFVDTSYSVNYNMEGETICLDDDVTYTAVNTGDDPVTGNVSYVWVQNGTDTISTGVSATVTDLQEAEYLELFVEGDFCYSGTSEFYDSLELPYIIRPGGELVLSGNDVSYDDMEDHYVLDGVILLDEDAVELEDDLNAADRFTMDLSDPTLWQFFWVSQSDSLIYDGEEGSIDNYIINAYPAITDATPPNWSAQSYDVTYYMVTTNGTCYDTSTAVLHIEYDIFIPNVFTPNEDGFYDTWTVENGLKYGPLSVQIFNRWGNLVYNSNAWDNAWLGINNDGEELPFGTYFYILETAVEGAPVFRGTVTILK